MSGHSRVARDCGLRQVNTSLFTLQVGVNRVRHVAGVSASQHDATTCAPVLKDERKAMGALLVLSELCGGSSAAAERRLAGAQ